MPKTAKIGAMPTSASTDDHHHSGSGRGMNSGRKGITIEDLKQQTAMRLAKQQESRQQQTALKLAKQQDKNHRRSMNFTSPHNRNYGGHARSPLGHLPHSQHPQTEHPPQHFTYSKVQMAQIPIQHSHNLSSPHIYHHQNHHAKQIPSVQTMHSFESEPSCSTSVISSDASIRINAVSPGGVLNLNNMMKAHKNSYKSYDKHKATNPSNKPGLKISKLPHGLTVQELKEMTRARLACEATDGSVSTSAECQTTPTDGSISEGVVSASTLQYNRPRVHSHETGVSSRNRLDSDDTYLTSPAPYNRGPPSQSLFSEPTYGNSLGTSRSSSRISNHQGISHYYSIDSTDTMSVNSYLTAYGSESFVGSDADASGRCATTASRDLGRSSTFPSTEEGEEYGSFMTNSSYDASGRRLPTVNPMQPPGLSNLMEDKPLSPEVIACESSLMGSSEFPGLPYSSTSDSDVLSDILQQQPPGHDQIHIRNEELPNAIVESVLGSLEGEHRPGPDVFHDYKSCMGLFCKDSSHDEDAAKSQNPWDPNSNGAMSKLEKEWNNVLRFDNIPSDYEDLEKSIVQDANVPRQKEDDLKSIQGTPLTPAGRTGLQFSRENFDDDGYDDPIHSPPSKDTIDEGSDALASKSINTKKRNNQRIRFWQAC